MAGEDLQPEMATPTRPRLIVGMGDTGLSVARYLHRRGIPFVVTDSRGEPPCAQALAALGDVACRFGEFGSPLPVEEIAEIVVSPGISLEEPFLRTAAEAGTPIIGDIELFARAVNRVPSPESRVPKILAITGSNGKSTVTALVAEMARQAGVWVAAGGNFGPPALDLLLESAELYVLEVSSFQLETTESLVPAAAVVLNVSADHIDRHGSIEHYTAVKARIYNNARVSVCNLADTRVARMATHAKQRVTFGDADGDWHLGTQDGRRWLYHDGEPVVEAGAMAMRGYHNELNALAALALGAAVGLPQPAMLATLRHFGGLPHRCQLVATIAGVEWINDSKGTNVGAMLASLAGVSGPIVLLAGGESKGADFTAVGPVMARKGRTAVLFGADAHRIAAALEGHAPIARVPDLQAAVAAAADAAQPGDTVLLSPGCASFDQFRNYADRGDQFITAVEELAA